MNFRLIENLQDHCSDNKIRWWYDRHTTSWVVQVFNGYNEEIDNTYCGNVVDRDSTIDYYRNQYQTLDARKFKPNESMPLILHSSNDGGSNIIRLHSMK